MVLKLLNKSAPAFESDVVAPHYHVLYGLVKYKTELSEV